MIRADTAVLRRRLQELRQGALRQLAEADTLDSGLTRLLSEATSGAQPRSQAPGGEVKNWPRLERIPAGSSVRIATKNGNGG